MNLIHEIDQKLGLGQVRFVKQSARLIDLLRL